MNHPGSTVVSIVFGFVLMIPLLAVCIEAVLEGIEKDKRRNPDA